MQDKTAFPLDKTETKPLSFSVKNSTEIYVFNRLQNILKRLKNNKIKTAVLSQTACLLQKRVPEILGMSVDEFLSFMEDFLLDSVQALNKDMYEDNIPLLLVLKEQLLPTDKLLSLLEIDGQALKMEAPLPNDLMEVQERKRVAIKRNKAKKSPKKNISSKGIYLITDISLGLYMEGRSASYLTYTINKCRKKMLTLQEGLFLVLYFPQKVKNFCIFCQASKINDASVPSIYPKKGEYFFGYSNRFIEYPEGIMPYYLNPEELP